MSDTLFPAAWVEAAYGEYLNRTLRHDAVWRQLFDDTPAPRRVRARRWCRNRWTGFRYALAKRIYDFPEEPW